MNIITHRASLAAALCGLLFAAAPSANAADPDPALLIAAMQDALVPNEPRLARVRVTVWKEQDELARRSWEALVARRRFDDGPRTAVTLMAPPVTRGSAMLTAPREDGEIGLWLYSPSERRARALAPFEADRNFLVTDFNYDDLALTTRDFVEPQLLGDEELDGRPTWKVEVKPAEEWYYSRIVTWIGKDTMLPIRREYYDRAYRLWKVVEMDDAIIDGIPTVLEVALHDVQTDSRSLWDVRAVSYGTDELDREMLSSEQLGQLDQQPFWQAVGLGHGNPTALSLAD
ncbi:MAG: outer membrane lipoprotein-sorting protein [Gammaproteobacteria bacterium]